MFPRILEYVDQSIPDLARGFERPHVITIAPDSPAAAEDPVHRLGESDREALDAPGKRAAVLRLDDEVKVIALHGELQDPEAATRSQYQAAAEGNNRKGRAPKTATRQSSQNVLEAINPLVPEMIGGSWRIAFSHILPPDIFRHTVTIVERTGTLRACFYFSYYYVHRSIEQFIRMSTPLTNKVTDQLPPDRLILPNSQLIIFRKPAKKLTEGFWRDRSFAFRCRHGGTQ